MSNRSQDIYRRLAHGFVAAVTCNTKLHVTLFVYGCIAMMLLAYVSAQVYTSALTQRITQLKRERHERKEALNKLTSVYISKSSRARVSEFCERELGMRQADDRSLARYTIHLNPTADGEPIRSVRAFPQSNDPYRFTLLRENGGADR